MFKKKSKNCCKPISRYFMMKQGNVSKKLCFLQNSYIKFCTSKVYLFGSGFSGKIPLGRHRKIAKAKISNAEFVCPSVKPALTGQIFIKFYIIGTLHEYLCAFVGKSRSVLIIKKYFGQN
jgi:hypothetical protein